MIDAKFKSVPVLQKPVERQTLSELLAHVGADIESQPPGAPRAPASYDLRRSVG